MTGQEQPRQGDAIDTTNEYFHGYGSGVCIAFANDLRGGASQSGATQQGADDYVRLEARRAIHRPF
ncbi:MAG: hypothetical protein ABL957_14585 [Parvularculaceae bacterium]